MNKSDLFKISSKSCRLYLCVYSAFYLLLAGEAMSEEIWPEQMSPPVVLERMRRLQDEPPFRAEERFYVNNKAFFFMRRSDLGLYLKKESELPKLLDSGAVKLLKIGRKLQAREAITSYSGRVYDEEFGDGYAILFTRF